MDHRKGIVNYGYTLLPTKFQTSDDLTRRSSETLLISILYITDFCLPIPSLPANAIRAPPEKWIWLCLC